MSTPYMSMTLPVPLTTAGPLWAAELTAALQVVDAHDHLPGSGAKLGIFGSGVLGVTYIFRPNGETGDPADMSAYIVHGKHVVSFTRPQAGLYVIQLDRAYEPDEISIHVNPLSSMYDYAVNADVGGLGEGLWGGTLMAVPVMWQTGKLGEKDQRIVTVHGIGVDTGTNVLSYNGRHSDPVAIMLVFFDRTSCDIHADSGGTPVPIPP